MIYIKIHDTENGHIVAMCDSSLIDKVLKDNETEINIKDYSDFYKGELIDPARVGDKIVPEKLYTANIVGRESVDAAIGIEIISEESVMMIDKVPYANAFRIKY